MSVNDVATHYTHLPSTFNLQIPPPWFDEEYIIVGIENPDGAASDDVETSLFGFDAHLPDRDWGATAAPNDWAPIPDFGELFPGAPVSTWSGDFRPPTDAYAFYLPFHLYFKPDRWGIYLIAERVKELAGELWQRTGGALSEAEAHQVTRLYLFKHEFFHEKVESFCARLEVAFRERIYLDGQRSLYARTFGTDACLEEALAEAYAYRQVDEVLKTKWRWRKRKRRPVLEALKAFIEDSPPGYRRGVEYLEKDDFEAGRSELAEAIRQEALGGASMDARVWSMFTYAFAPVGNIRSRVNYLVHQDSWLGERMQLQLQRISYGKLVRKLKDVCGCEFERNGKGSHRIWRAETGRMVVVPEHPRDLKTGTLRSIVKTACGDMPLEEFLAKD